MHPTSWSLSWKSRTACVLAVSLAQTGAEPHGRRALDSGTQKRIAVCPRPVNACSPDETHADARGRLKYAAKAQLPRRRGRPSGTVPAACHHPPSAVPPGSGRQLARLRTRHVELLRSESPSPSDLRPHREGLRPRAVPPAEALRGWASIRTSAPPAPSKQTPRPRHCLLGGLRTDTHGLSERPWLRWAYLGRDTRSSRRVRSRKRSVRRDDSGQRSTSRLWLGLSFAAHRARHGCPGASVSLCVRQQDRGPPLPELSCPRRGEN